MRFEAYSRGLAAGTILAALTACGGGGGDNPADAPVQRLSISETNAAAVSAEAIDAGGAARSSGEALTGVQVSGASAESASTMTALVGALRRARDLQAPAAVVGATVSATDTCTGGGTVTLTGTKANPDVDTAGDNVNFTFNSCVEGGVTLNGSLSAAIVSVNPAQTLEVVDVGANQFTATRLGIGGRLHGTVRVTLDDTDPAKSVVQVGSSSISFNRLVAGNVRATRTLSNYAYLSETTVATGSVAETFSYDASGSFPRLGTYAFSAKTTQPVVTPAGAAVPSSGAGKVTGANGSSVTITVITGGVRLEVDRNGDNVIDAVLTRSWAELDGEL
jgi:hypothetical protein